MLTRLFCNCSNLIPLTSAAYQRSGNAASDLAVAWSLAPIEGDELGDELGSGTSSLVAGTDDEYEILIPYSVASQMTAGDDYALTILDTTKGFGIRCDCKADYYRGGVTT